MKTRLKENVMDLAELHLAQRMEHEEQEENEKLIRVTSSIFSVFMLLMCLGGIWFVVKLVQRF